MSPHFLLSLSPHLLPYFAHPVLLDIPRAGTIRTMHILLLALLAGAQPVEAPDVAVVCPAKLAAALDTWLEHRGRQGHRIALVPGTIPPKEIRRRIRRIAEAGNLRHVVIVGDSEPGLVRDPVLRARCVPAHTLQAKVNIHWGSEPEIASDNWYADLDDDGVPEVAIGRLTADSPDELRRITAKIIEYEHGLDFGPWRRRVNFIAGVGGFGRMADAVLELAAKRVITDRLPAAFDSTMTYASWRSPYCPDPRRFQSVAIERLNEGCLFWVYIGHGQCRALDRVRVPGAHYPILDANDLDRVDCRHGSPIALFMSCYAGAYDAEEDCLAEDILRTPGAPVAVIAGSRVTMPYAMTILGTGLLDECFMRRAATLGEALLRAKQQLARDNPADTHRKLLDMMAAAISPRPKQLADERREHIQLFNLIGDPLLRLRHPHEVRVTVPERITAGTTLSIEGTAPIAGRCTIELVSRRDLIRKRTASRSQFDPRPATLGQQHDEYQAANDPRWATHTLDLPAGPFQCTLAAPTDAWGPGHIRIHIAGTRSFALGASDIQIDRAKRSAASAAGE